MKLRKLIVILGPTASGKSDLAVELAKKIGGLNHTKGMVGRTSRSEVLGEVISADSRQVYKGMDLGTGKITKKEMKGVTHHLLDVCSPKKVFTVAEYKKLAEKAIKDILKRKKIPIICGGTGFYIDAVVLGTEFPSVSPNKDLRFKIQDLGIEQLLKMLKKLDPERAENVDTKNKVRLVRAIEVATALGKVPPTKNAIVYDSICIGIKWPKEVLRERIYSRIISRIKKGMIKEIENLHESGVSWKRMYSLGLEYRYISLFLQGKLTKEEMIETLHTKTCQYAKRQMTWFKRNKNIVWLEPWKLGEAEKVIRLFLKK
ncbi:MAG: tRNA (adenosine(37)-N6)-dimethylallyltransferase MiaA [bacterium]